MAERRVKCSHPGCPRVATVFGMCRSHYREYKKDVAGERLKNLKTCGNCIFFITANPADGHTGDCHFKKIIGKGAGDACCRHCEPNVLGENPDIETVEQRVKIKKIENRKILGIKLRVAGYALLAIALLAATIGCATIFFFN